MQTIYCAQCGRPVETTWPVKSIICFPCLRARIQHSDFDDEPTVPYSAPHIQPDHE